MNAPITIRQLISEENGYETLRQLGWPKNARVRGKPLLPALLSVLVA